MSPYASDAAITLDQVEQHLLSEEQDRPESTRTTTLNLICTTRDADDAAQLATALNRIAPRHPGRFLLLVENSSLAEGDAAGRWVVRILHTSAPPARRAAQVLQLEGGGRAWRHGSSAIAPLLVGELPVFLWWRNESPIGNARFLDLASIAERVVLDSMELEPDAAGFARIADLHRALPHGCCLTDMVWARVTRWRQVIAQAWEAVEICRACDVRKIRLVACCSRPALNGAALLVAGWLSSRLHWKPGRALDARRVEMRGAQGEAVELSFEESGGGTPLALLHAVHALSGDARPVFSVARDAGRVAIRLGEEGRDGEAVNDFQLIEPMDALCQELDIRGSDQLYRQSLEAGVEIFRLLERAK